MGRKSDARQRLMDAGHVLIWEYSYGSVTIEAICEKAKVKKGSFYYFFNSKSDLAIAAIDAWWEDRIRKYLDFVAQRQITAYETNGHILGCPLFNLGAEICTQDEQIKVQIQGILSQVLGYFESALRDAQVSGEIKGKNAAFQARLLFCCYEGLLTMARLDNNPELMRTLTSDVMASLDIRPCLVPKMAFA